MSKFAILICTILLAAPMAQAAKVPLRMIASTPGQVREPSKREVITRLKQLQEKQGSEVMQLDQSIHKILEASKELEVDDDNLLHVAQRTDRMAKQIDQLTRERNEKNARREVIDRIIFTIDTKWAAQPLKPFLEKAFLEMASKDLGDGRDARLWKAFTYLSICVREVPEPREEVLDVLEGYLNFSGVLNPKTPAEFLASRSYTNGAESVAAQAIPKERVGDTIPVPRLEPPPVDQPVLEMRSTLPEQTAIEAPEYSEPITVDDTVSAVSTGMSPNSNPPPVVPTVTQ
ncbi:MAG: hypothetical protein AAB250_14890 [Bdellovibrionota bacterium]